MDLQDIRKRYNANSVSESVFQNKFNRFHVTQQDHVLENTFGYVFFTKPDLNIFDRYSAGTTINNDFAQTPQFYNVVRTDRELLKNLKMNTGYSNFIVPFYNHIQNFDTADETIKTRESGETSTDWKIVYGTRINESRTCNSFNSQFDDNRNMDVYKLLYTWVNYIDLISGGVILPDDYNRKNRILDYACSVYYFLTSEDGESIIFFTKYLGVFPKNIPSSAYAYSKGNFKRPEYNVEFQYSYKMDYDPSIIFEFNKIASANKTSYIPIYNSQDAQINTTIANNAFIEVRSDGKLKLRFN